MLKFLLASSLCIGLLNASSIDELVKNSFSRNLDIKGLEKSIEIATFEISQAKNWQNPMLAIKSNNIMLNKNRLNENKEYGVELSQAIPIGKKLELEEKIALKDKNIQAFNLEDKKLELESKIYLYSYNILINEQRYKLLEDYLKNLQKLENLYSKLYKYEKATLKDILNTQISSIELKIELEKLKTTIDNLYLNLELITYEKIEKIDDNLSIKDIRFEDISQDILTHPKIKNFQENSLKYKDIAQLEEAKKFSEITLSVEYMQNENQDYANIALSLPLPIYKTENINRLKANLSANETNEKLDSFIHNLNLQSKIFVNKLTQNKNSFNTYQEEIIPLKQKLQDVLENNIRFQEISFDESIKNINELINYEIKSLDILENYFEAYSELIYYTNKGITK